MSSASSRNVCCFHLPIRNWHWQVFFMGGVVMNFLWAADTMLMQ